MPEFLLFLLTSLRDVLFFQAEFHANRPYDESLIVAEPEEIDSVAPSPAIRNGYYEGTSRA